MIKKVLYFIMLICSISFIVGCTNDTTSSSDQSVFLPDLSDQSKTDIEQTLDDLGITYEFLYETNENLSEDTFIRYEGNTSGDPVTTSDLITIVISTQKIVLPDLSGMNQTEILQVF